MKKTTKFIIIALIVAVLCGVGVYVEMLYNVGIVDKRPASYENVYAVGKDIKIYTDELQEIVDRDRTTNPNFDEASSKENALNYLVRRETLYQAAVDKGYSVTDKEAQDYVDKQIEAFSPSSNAVNYGDFEAFLKGTGMTLEEYWQSQYDTLRKELVTSKYLEKLRTDFLMKTKSKDPQAAWQEEYDKMTKKLIDKQKVRVLE